ncbi:hypothetical protein ACFE04_024394 [Oxalis oulophora]
MPAYALGRILILLGVTFLGCAFSEENPISMHTFSGYKRHWHHVEKHPVKSIQSEDGDIIDCIDIYEQPAFDHPALKNHVIQMEPSYEPTIEENTEKMERPQTSQVWRKSGSCQKRTIPIRRMKDKESVKSYQRKKPNFHHHNPANHDDSSKDNLYLLQKNHSKAILITVGYMYSGAKTDMKVWNPYVETKDEYSSSRVSLESGPYYNFESIESGWMVNPGLYGDKETRLHTYWTVDASKKTGCFDLTCPGFVQTNKDIALGGVINPPSDKRGLPREITIYIYKDPITGNWWLQYGERTNIGYWPAKLFKMLVGNAQTANWGGEVYSPRMGKYPHTRTGMGNGRFPDWFSGNSGLMRRIRIRDSSHNLKLPDWVQTYADEYKCYNVQFVKDYLLDPEFLYGGPGRTYTCP